MDSTDIHRRTLLRGLATAGCALGLPVVLTACDQAQESSQKGPTVPDAVQDEVGKASKERVEYQGKPNDGQVCAQCVQYLPESGRCRIVAGPIEPQGWCIAWTADTSASPSGEA